MGFLSLVSPNRRPPTPRATGKIFSRSSSTQVVLDQRAYELRAAGEDDVPAYVLLQRRDLVKHVALEGCRVVPGGIGEGRGHDVLGQAVQPVRQLVAARWPPRGEPLVAFAGPAVGPRRPAPGRARAWQAAGYFRSGRPSRRP
jgi:hypothetical protein